MFSAAFRNGQRQGIAMHQHYSLLSATLLLAFSMMVVPVAAQETQVWLHVHIEGQAGEITEIDFPLAALEAMLSMAPETLVSNGEVKVGEQQGISIVTLREMWLRLRNGGDMDFIAWEAMGQKVRLARVDDKVEIRVNGPQGNLRGDMPVTIVNALFSSEGDILNIPAAIAELKSLRGDIINIIEDDREVRAWIDEIP